MIGFLLGLLLAAPVAAQNITMAGPFTGLNDANATITLDPSQAQALLNVEVSEDGLGIVKRKGYTLTDSLSISTASVNGAVSFKDSEGNIIRLVAHDRFISKSVNGGVFSNILSTMPVGAKWDFCESAGRVFAFNDNHDEVWSYDGTLFTYYPLIPKASICAITSTRMLIAGTTDFPNRLYFSEAGDYTNFVVDIEVESPSFDDIGLAGEKITALFATEAEWLIAKSNSITSYQGTNQYDLVASVVSNRVGIVDPNAIVQHEGIVYFKGSDYKIWAYTSGTMVDISKQIETFTSNISKSSATLSVGYTSSADFDLGTYYNVTSSRTYNAIEPLLYSKTDSTTEDFNLGTADASIITTGDKIQLDSWSSSLDLTAGYFQNIGAELGEVFPAIPTNWSRGSAYGAIWQVDDDYNTAVPTYGNYFFVTFGVSVKDDGFVFQIRKASNDEIVYNTSRASGDGGWQYSAISVDMSAYEDTNYYIYSYCEKPTEYFQSTTFTRGTITATLGTGRYPIGSYACYLDIDEVPPSASTGTFISQVHAIGAPQPHYGYMVESSSITDYSSIDFSIAFATAATGVFTNWQSTSSVWISTHTHIKWKAEIATTTNTLVGPYINSVALNFQSTGYWLSDEYFVGGVGSWGQFRANNTTTGTGSWTYTIAVSTFSGGTDSATYEALTPSAVITASTGTYVRIKAQNDLSVSTDIARTNDLSYDWNTVTDKQAAAFEYNGDIYFAVPYARSGTNNRVMKFDIDKAGWTIFDIPMNYPYYLDGVIVFGSPAGGYVYKYPYGNSDNGAAINSYWKTKDYIGNNPYVEKDFQKMSVIAGTNNGSTLNATYTIDTDTNTTYNISLTNTASNFVKNNRYLDAGDTGHFFNLQIGNNAADQPWSFYGASVDYVEKPWRVQPEE